MFQSHGLLFKICWVITTVGTLGKDPAVVIGVWLGLVLGGLTFKNRVYLGSRYTNLTINKNQPPASSK